MSDENIKREYHENGKLKTECPYNENGNKHGLFREWFDNGNLAVEDPCIDGKRDGMYKVWHKNGQLGLETPFQKGLKHGTQRMWNKKGKLVQEIEFFQNAQHGIDHTIHKDGTETKIYFWNGSVVEFDERKSELMAVFLRDLGYAVSKSDLENTPKDQHPKPKV